MFDTEYYIGRAKPWKVNERWQMLSLLPLRSFTGRIWHIHELDFCRFFESRKMSEKNCKNSGSRLHSIDYHPTQEKVAFSCWLGATNFRNKHCLAMSHLALKPGHSRFIQKYSRNISSVLGSPTKGRVKKKIGRLNRFQHPRNVWSIKDKRTNSR